MPLGLVDDSGDDQVLAVRGERHRDALIRVHNRKERVLPPQVPIASVVLSGEIA